MPSIVEDLKKTYAFPGKNNKISFIQTHISNVFIGDRFVYKIKKPVNFGFLDFSTLEKRKYYCEREVELNNRFSKGVYIGVYPVTFDGNKHYIDGKGKVVDFAVKMKRLNDKDLLKSRFKQKKVNNLNIENIAKAIADFHNNSERSKEIDKFGKISVVKFNTDENFQQTKKFINNSITKNQFFGLKEWTDEFYKNNPNLFSTRIINGKIRDCHGDLHMEHIVLTDPIIIFDCIEFNNRFRYSDIISDISFLLMDLEFNDGKKLADRLLNKYLIYTQQKNENKINDLIKFYKIYRAYVRGKVTSFILDDKNISENKKDNARKIAQRYFSLAHSYIN